MLSVKWIQYFITRIAHSTTRISLAFLRQKNSFLMLTASICFIAFQLYYFASHSDNYADILRYPHDHNNNNNGNTKNTFKSKGSRIIISETNSPVSTLFENLLKDNGVTLAASSHEEKCDAFFTELYKMNPDWVNNDFSSLPYDGGIFNNKDGFISNYLKKYKENKEKADKVEISKEDFEAMVKEKGLRALAEEEYKVAVKETRNTERTLVDLSTSMRAYGACFLGQYGEMSGSSSSSKSKKPKVASSNCHDIEIRLFPWLSRNLPVYTRWDGTSMRSIPTMSDYVNIGTSGASSKFSGNNNQCYLKSLRDSLNGKGYAISASDHHFDELKQLIPLLRILGNRLPIQIVHKGDMSERTMKRIVNVARDFKPNFDSNPNWLLFLQSHNLPVSLLTQDLTKDQWNTIYPKQEIWFVDAKDSISEQYHSRFNSYANKFLAYFFSSFEDILLIDTDTVPLADLNKEIFQSKFYKEHSAVFFKDREVFYQGVAADKQFFLKLLPSEADNIFFNVPPATDFTKKNRFLGGKFAHLMESGVVAINKKNHFLGVLTTVQIQIWSPAASKFWGDKELFWLGLSISGDENYFFNYYAAGAGGVITPRELRVLEDEDDLTRRNKLISTEVCSTHPTHISSNDNQTVLWMNSGFNVCKKANSAEGDFKGDRKLKKMFKSLEQVEEYYNSITDLEAIIVPRPSELYIDNDKGENRRGWEIQNLCRGYIYCAYDYVGGKIEPETTGHLIKVDPLSRNMYKFYGSVWNLLTNVDNKTFDPPEAKKKPADGKN